MPFFSNLYSHFTMTFQARPVMTTVILLLLAVMFCKLAPLPYDTAMRRNHSQKSAIGALNFCALFFPLLWIAALIWACWNEKAAAGVAEEVGPGVYSVYGVESATSRDMKRVIDALSQANAKVKAELKGVVVTKVTFQSPLDEAHFEKA